MKFLEIFSFEVGYQARRVSTWLYFALLLSISFYMARQMFVSEAAEGGYFVNAPFATAQVTLVASLFALLALAPFAGSAAARDVETRLQPILYAAPIDKFSYLGGRFLAAFTISALMVITIPIGILGAALVPGGRADLMGPIRLTPYASAYFLIALPNAFVATALMFTAALFGRRGVVSFFGGAFVLFAAVVSWQVLASSLGYWSLAKLTDPLGLTVFGELSKLWTPGEKNSLVVGQQNWMILNRLVWLGLALSVLAVTYFRFRFAHHGADRRRRWWGRKQDAAVFSAPNIAESKKTEGNFYEPESALMPPRQNQRAFGFSTHLFQMMAVARESFRMIAGGWGIPALVVIAVFINLTAPLIFQDDGFPQLPTTGEFVNILDQSGEHGIWLIIPLLIFYYAGELIWREREARLNEIVGAAPVPTWVFLAGKFSGIACALFVAQLITMGAAMIAQARMGYYEFETALYVKILFGMRLTDYLLYAAFALAVHVIVDQKYISHLILIVTYVLVAFGPQFGIEPGLLVYGSDPGWTYSDMRGLAPFVGPWLLFKAYWTVWALLLAALVRLLWVRGKENHPGARLRIAQRRFTRATAVTVTLAAMLVIMFGGLIFYNINVLSAKRAAPGTLTARSAEYERRYGQYGDIPQPRPVSTNLRVEIYPKLGSVEIHGVYDLANKTSSPISSVHVATASEAKTRTVVFSRPAKPELIDEELGHRIYTLEKPLSPGDSLQLEFEISYAPRGFPRQNIDTSVVPNGTFFGAEWLPAIGYQKNRELRDAGDRQAYGLTPRPEAASLGDPAMLANLSGREPIMFDAVVGTDEGQTAVATGALRREWSENGRHYFHYSTDSPIKNNYDFFSAAYSVRKAQWKDVEIEIIHHPKHDTNLNRMVSSVQASLDYLTRELGPYPYRQIRFIEHPGGRRTLYANAMNIRYQEGFSFVNADSDPRGIDLPFAVTAHEVAHQWWGQQLMPAAVVGAPILTESLAWYSALEIVEAHYGRAHCDRLISAMREDFLSPRARAGAPLLRATDRFQWYRKGVLALLALREYIGAEQIDAALKRFFEKYRMGAPPLPTTLDLYKELQAATPEDLRYLLADLFEANTFWELATKNIEAKQLPAGEWQVTLDIDARKVVVDEQGIETEVPMNDFVEIGVSAAEDEHFEEPLYLQKHRVRSGEQRITVIVPKKPAQAGIDPRSLLIDVEPNDNSKAIYEP
jgi:ABC-2 type transport system permease protein